jgi:hypothetical protein
MSFKLKSTSPERAAARICRIVFVDPPMAISKAMALEKAAFVAMERGRTELSSFV